MAAAPFTSAHNKRSELLTPLHGVAQAHWNYSSIPQFQTTMPAGTGHNSFKEAFSLA